MDDYRDAKSYSSSTEAEEALTSRIHTAWWVYDDDDDDAAAKRAAALQQAGKMLAANSETRIQANIRHARLYENVDLANLTGPSFVADAIRQTLSGIGIISLNVVSACIDTLQAKIAKNKPRPAFLTTGGNWKQQQKARQLELFTNGLFYETKVYQHAQRVFVDACTFGTGVLQIFMNSEGRLECERVSIDEIFVDDLDGTDMAPRQILRRKYVQREVLLGMFPKHRECILSAANPQTLRSGASIAAISTTSDVLEVWEGWHLPAKEGDEYGRHSIVVGNEEVFTEQWKTCVFPFVIFRFKNRLRGFWGKGVAEALTGIQLELNRLLQSISEQLRRKGRGRIFVQTGSKVNPNHLTNDIADIVYYTGAPPIVDSQNAVAQEEFMQIDRLYQKAFQEVGISELSAAAKKPSGLDAAVALREYSDIESERFAIIHQAWETFFTEFATTCLELLEDQFSIKGYKVRMPNKRYVLEIDLKDIDLDRDSYIMQIWPVSSLPSTPAARYQKVREMMQDGFIDRPVAQRLLEFPDIDAEQNLGNAALDDVDATISAILDEKTPKLLPLEPYQNASLMIARAQAAYLYARHHGAEEQRLDMLRQLIDQASMILMPPQSAPAEMQGPAMMPPPAGTMPNVGPMVPSPAAAPQPPAEGVAPNVPIQ